MSVSERRIARRFILNVPLQLLPIKASSQVARTVETMNISTRGVYFTTDLPLSQGQLVQVLLQMPKEITGNGVSARRFTGRVISFGLEWVCKRDVRSGRAISILRRASPAAPRAGAGKFRGAFDPTGITPQRNPAIPRVRDRHRVAVCPRCRWRLFRCPSF